jgi:hypothetical protein
MRALLRKTADAIATGGVSLLVEPRPEPDLVEPVARCLAKLDERFVSAERWAASEGDRYRERARAVLRTIDAVRSGNGTGGLPPRRS